MYAITGITGNVGGTVARTLLAAGAPVRAVLRDASKAKAWAGLGCEVAVAKLDDAPALTAAFRGTTGVFVLPPPNFDPEPGFPEAKAVAAAVSEALGAACPARVVSLSTVGAQAEQTNLLTQQTLMERALARVERPITFLRPAWFMDNSQWDIARAKADGVLACFLQPLERAIPMVAAADVGRVAAELLQAEWTGKRVVELAGPELVSQTKIAETLANLLGRPVRAEAVPRANWQAIFEAQGMHNPLPRMQMLDGFNEGWLRFEGGTASAVRGKVSLAEVLGVFVRASG